MHLDPEISWYPIPERSELPEDVAKLFGKAESALGFVPNVFQAMTFRVPTDLRIEVHGVRVLTSSDDRIFDTNCRHEHEPSTRTVATNTNCRCELSMRTVGTNCRHETSIEIAEMMVPESGGSRGATREKLCGRQRESTHSGRHCEYASREDEATNEKAFQYVYILSNMYTYDCIPADFGLSTK